MTPCPRCEGAAVPVVLVDEEANLPAVQCLLCGWVFDEPLLDHHHSLPVPPPPHVDNELPIFRPAQPRRRRRSRPRGRPPGSPLLLDQRLVYPEEPPTLAER